MERPRIEPSIQLQVASDLHVLIQLPVDLPTHWKESLGNLRIRELADANLFVLCVRDSKAPEVLDSENLALVEDTKRFYFGMLMSVPYAGHPPATMMTGAHCDGRIDVRQVQLYEGVFYPTGGYGASLTRDILTDAYSVAEGIRQLQGQGEYSRMGRIIHAFYAGLKSDDPGTRIHEFIRCVEGFVQPKIGRTRKDIVHRSKLFVGAGHEGLLGHLFEIRSAVEHLHGPLSKIPAGDDCERRLLLLQRAYEAEAIARFCIHRLFSRSQLWEYFRDDAALEQFWVLDERPREALWGGPLDLGAALGLFDRRRASMQL